jgi:flagellar assembly factor FliW
MQKMNQNQTQDAQNSIHLPDGMVGLPGMQNWQLVENQPAMPLMWLQSLDRPGFRLPVTEPGYFDQNYSFDLDDQAETKLGTPAVEDLVVMIVTTVHEGGGKVTGNLAAPIVVNTRNWNGLQCILDDRKYSLHQEIDYVRFNADLPAEDESVMTEQSVGEHLEVETADQSDPVLIES